MKTAFMIAVLTLSGCEHWDSCENTADCYSPAVCVSGRCEAFEDSDSVTNNMSTATNNATNNPQIINNGSTGAANNSTSGQTQNAMNNLPSGNCVVDPDAACSDPSEDQRRNDSPDDAVRPSDEHGCFFSDILTPASYSLSGQLCGRESGDWYVQRIRPCDSNTIIARVTVTPTMSCEQADWELSLRREGGQLLCSDSSVNCTQDGESKTVRWLIPPSGSSSTFYYGVEAAGPIQFPYTIEFSIK